MKKIIMFSLFVVVYLYTTTITAHAHGDRNDYHVYADEAGRIMGDRFFYGHRQLEQIFGTVLNRSTINAMYEVPFLKSTLENCRRCMLFYYLPRYGLKGRDSSIKGFLSSRTKWIKKSFAENRRTAWYKNQRFAKQILKPGWHLIRVDVDGKTFSTLAGFYSVGAREKIAPPVLYVYAMMLNPDLFAGRFLITDASKNNTTGPVLVGRVKTGKGNKIVIDSTLHQGTGRAVEIMSDTFKRKRFKNRPR